MSTAMQSWKRARQRRERNQKRARLEYLETCDLSAYSAEQVALMESGAIEVCPVCSGASAYCWDDCSESDQPAKHEIAHIGAASGFEWQCGHCRAYLAPVDSAINAPLFTHCDD